MFKFNQFLTEKKRVFPDIHTGKQPWASVADAEAAYNVAIAYVQDIENEFSRILKKSATHGSKILINTKSKESFLDKITNRGKQKETGDITDILRGAILVSTPEEVDIVTENIKKNSNVYEIETKEKGEEKEFGYFGSTHFLLSINGVLVELQVMTKRLWSYKNPSHEIYQKWRSHTPKSKEEFKQLEKDKKRSQALFKIGNSNAQEKEAKLKLAKYKDFKRGKFEYGY